MRSKEPTKMKPITTLRKAPTSPVLIPYIKYFWSMKAPEAVQIDQWLVPVCNGDLVINLSAPARCTEADGTVTFLKGACICGIRRQCTRIEQSGPLHVMGAAFYPAGLYPFISGPMDITVGHTLSAKRLMPEFTFVLTEEMEANEAATLALLEASLLTILENTDPRMRVIPKSVTEFCAIGGQDTIKTFCQINGISSRTLERLIKKYVGLSPREYISLARMQNAVRGVIDNPRTSLTEQAYEYGFYDQPHFTREFREKLNRTPSDFKLSGNSVLETIRRK